MLIVVPPEQADAALALLPEASLVGEITAGDGSVSVSR
jgi:hypothetical protein